MKIQLTASSFLDWYFADDQDRIIIGEKMEFMLKKFGVGSLTVENLFDEQDELPYWICTNVPEEYEGDEYIPADKIEFINDLQSTK